LALAEFRKAMEKVTKDHKKAIVAANANTLIHKISFDSPQLTYMFGGFSYDRIHNFFGPESSGKSSMFTYIAGQLQKKIPLENPEWKEKQIVIYMDFERTFDPEYAKNLGLNCDEDHFLLLQPDTLEEGCSITEALVKTNSVCCVILDSDAAAPTNLDNESDIGATGFNGAKAANTLKEVYKRFNVLCSNYKFPLLVVSQERANMQVGAHLPSTTGGTALKFFSSTRCRIQKMDVIKNGDNTIGIQIRARNYKNKTSVPNRDALMDLYFQGGFNSSAEYFTFITKFHLLTHKDGTAWWSWIDTENRYGEGTTNKKGEFVPKEYKWQGAGNAQAWLEEHPDFYDELKRMVDKKLCVSNELDANNVDPEIEDAKEAGVRLTTTSEASKKEIADLASEALQAASAMGLEAPEDTKKEAEALKEEATPAE
jgi:recombination protein RecA